MSSQLFTRSKIFIYLLLSSILGIYLGNFLQLSGQYYFLATSLFFLFFSLSLMFKNKKITTLFACLLFLIAGSYYINYYLDKNTQLNSSEYLESEYLEFKAIIIDNPDIRNQEVKYVLEIMESQKQELLNKKILLSYDKYPMYNYGDKVLVNALVQEPENWDNFDYRAYLAKDQISYIIKNNHYSDQTKLSYISHESPSKLLEKLFQVKQYLQKIINRLFSEPEAGIISAVTLGNKHNISETLADLLAVVGLSHIVVISGFYVTTLILIYKKLTKALSKWLVFLLGTGLLVGFVILTGASASVIRASLMAWLFLLAPMVGRKGNMINVFILTISLMIWQNPLILTADMGFQLSVASVLGLIYFSDYFAGWFKRYGEVISVSLGATISAQLTTLPLVIYYFSRLSLVAIVSNILVVPFLPLMILGAIIVILIAVINLKIAWIISWPIWLVARYMVFITEKLASFKFAAVDLNLSQDLFLVMALVYYLLLVLFAYKITKQNVIKKI